MSIRMIKFVVILSGIFLITGCKNKNSDVNVPEPNKVINDISKTIETSSDYLGAQSKVAIEAAEKKYSDLESGIQGLVSKIKNSGDETMQDMSKEIDSQLSITKQKLTNLKQAGEKDYQKAADEFNAAFDKLKDTYNKTKDEFEKNNQT